MYTTSRKRILVLSLAWYPLESGGEVAPRHIIDLSPDYDFDVVTYRFDPSWPKEERVGRASVFRLPACNKYHWMWRAFWFSVGRHRKCPYDAFWSIMAGYAGGVAYWLKVIFRHTPLLLTLQEGDPFAHIAKRVGIFSIFFRGLFRRANVIQAISLYLAKWGREMGHKGEPVVIPNGVALEKFQMQSKKATGEASFPKNGRQVVLVGACRLVPKNGIDIIIRALAHLPENVIYRNPGKDEKGLKKELLLLARELGVSHRVELLEDIPLSEIPAHLHAGDIFVRPSRSEGLGASFLEAMAAGLPIIATEVGGIPDFLTHEKTGLFTKVDDPEDLARRIRRLMEDAQLRLCLAAAGPALVRERYSWDTVAKRMQTEVFTKLFPGS